MNSKIALPIDSLKEEILSAFENFSTIILKASPGSGKTTRVPLYLLSRTNKTIYILEPRRLAAKLAAIQVAKELGEKVGHTVGYVFRFEKVMSDKTRILFLTEGTFLKILSQNKNLDDVGLVVLDEFHERHLSTDASLSFLTKLQKESRTDLKLMVMSATIETENLQNYLSKTAPTTTLELQAQRFSLRLTYLPNTTSIIQAPLTKKIRNAIEEILSSEALGDILVFLPGMKEIREAHEALRPVCEAYEVLCLILHGEMDSSEQDEVLQKNSKRKIILSTNVAESSVTIAGIRIVVDAGLQRESSYNFFSGLPELKIAKISKASATQRAGRANREGPGLCLRLYAELDFDQRPDFIKPEISKSDLSELYLLALDLFREPLEKLDWLESPPESALKNGRELLAAINAIDLTQSNAVLITTLGKKILNYPLHPRLGRILCEAQSADKKTYLDLLEYLADLLKEKNRARFMKLFAQSQVITSGTLARKSLEELILSGFPDRVARARGEKFYDVITTNGETLKIAREIAHEFDPLHPLWVVLDLNNKGEASRCIAIDELWLYDIEPSPLVEEVTYAWDDKKELVIKNERTLLGKIILSELKSTPKSSNDSVRQILRERARGHLKTLYDSQEFERLLTLKKIILNKNSELLLKEGLNEEELLKNFFSEQIHFNQNDKLQLSEFFFQSLKEFIDPDDLYQLDLDFPMTIQLSDRRKIPIIYDRTQDPSIESLIQDFYGLSKTPIIAKGKIPLTLKLLGPHKLALQVTQDLASFWSKTYPQMKKELSRDYPRHHWPDDPQNAKPILLKRQLPPV